jgi:hypothetical protein
MEKLPVQETPSLNTEEGRSSTLWVPYGFKIVKFHAYRDCQSVLKFHPLSSRYNSLQLLSKMIITEREDVRIASRMESCERLGSSDLKQKTNGRVIFHKDTECDIPPKYFPRDNGTGKRMRLSSSL